MPNQRPTLTRETFVDAPTAARELNTRVLIPLYSRVEKLEKRQLVKQVITVPAVVANAFPVTIQAGFPLKSVRLVNAWNETDNTAPVGLDQPIFRDVPAGKMQLVWLGLTASKKYTLTFEVSG